MATARALKPLTMSDYRQMAMDDPLMLAIGREILSTLRTVAIEHDTPIEQVVVFDEEWRSYYGFPKDDVVAVVGFLSSIGAIQMTVVSGEPGGEYAGYLLP